ncbi:MAG: metallophosphoesterase family protein [Bryobacteraceae bacterium]
MRILSTLLLIAAGGVVAYTTSSEDFRFVILGDRTGGAVPGVYEKAWHETDRDRPDFVVSVGDTIEGGNDLTLDAEWQQIVHMLAPYRRYRLFLTPGNHDVWSAASAQAFEKYSKRPLHYSFDYRQAHFTVLDNSRSDSMPAEELAYLQKDLQIHQKQSVKFIFSHRPSWILQAVLGNPDFPLHRLAKRYGVKYVIAGHVHEMLHFEVDGLTYLSIASSGGHLRGTKRYEDGWFFQHTLVTVRGNSVKFAIKELDPPFGRSRLTQPGDWGPAGLLKR